MVYLCKFANDAPVNVADITDAELKDLIATLNEERTVRNYIAYYAEKQVNGHGPPLPAVCVRKICESFSTERGRILRELRWDGLNGCWCFILAGMYVGVEKDGYIHS